MITNFSYGHPYILANPARRNKKVILANPARRTKKVVLVNPARRTKKVVLDSVAVPDSDYILFSVFHDCRRFVNDVCFVTQNLKNCDYNGRRL